MTQCLIVITDDTKEDLYCGNIYSKSIRNVWVLYTLSLTVKQILCNNMWLNNLHLNAVQSLLKKQFPHTGRLQNTIMLQSSTHAVAVYVYCIGLCK